MTDRPVVSVGLPIYNAARFLAGSLDGLLAQTFRDFELIISDNASTDASVQLCEQYAARDARVQVHRADRNHGVTWNHNRVLELARGTYFKWCGADDLVGPRFLEACVDTLERRPDAVVAYPLTILIDDQGKETGRTPASRLPLDSSSPVERFGVLLSPWPWTHTPFYGLMRISAVRAIRPLQPILAADRSFLSELTIRGPFISVEEFLMYRRLHQEHRERDQDRETALMAPGAVFAAREWRMLREHLTSALRAPLGLSDRLRLVGVVLGWSVRTWRDLADETVDLLRYIARRLGIKRTHVPV